VVAAAVPAGSVGRIEQGVDLLAGEVADDPALVTLGRDGEHPLDLTGVLGMAAGRANRNSDRIAARRALRVRMLLCRCRSR